ncbi:S1C family serine protease [Blattabacterium cuenoti]|uniref:S1C family serine protease n=1 Tax=Blattabacterium cuenoti TaxID=1653831 RepID=UPI001EEC8F40|nr:trypsin-like peptidase domain-containing protein [Blattabacterium cuenoti]
MSSIISIVAYKKYSKENKSKIPTYALEENKLTSSTLNYSSLEHSNIPDFTRVVKKTIHTVVNVKNYSDKYNDQFDPFDFFFGFSEDFNNNHQKMQQEEHPGLHGSGVIISSDGYIVTNHHVIQNADKIEITLNNQRTYEAKLIGSDPSTDISLLKINEKNLPFIFFSDSNKVQVGEWVLAIGNPFDLNSTVTAGIISAKNRSIGLLKGEPHSSSSAIESFFQTDAAVNPGNSGGALINTQGELIGINTAISSDSGNFIGYSFAAPSNLVSKVIQDIQKYGSVQRAFLGVKGMDLSHSEFLQDFNKKTNKHIQTQKGFLIGEVFEKSAADEGGLMMGDVIKKIDGKMIENASDLSFIIGMKHPGDQINMDILRDEQKISCKITLKDLIGNKKIEHKYTITPSELLGGSFESIDFDSKRYFNINFGIKIKKITNGFLHDMGIDEGDIILYINGKKMEKPKDVDQVLKQYSGDVMIKFIKKNGQLYIVGFEINH